MRGDSRRLLLALLLTLLPLAAQAQPSPYKRYRTLDTEHFHVHVPVGLEKEGRVAGAAAERAYTQLARELKPPRGTIDLVVTDDADYSNGYATPLPSNRIVVFATPPIESNSLRLNEDWLALVITHELAHIFHLDRADGLWGVAQHIFGRAPGMFPNAYGPSWLTEGLAVYYESRLTPGGRLKNAESKLFARAAALDQRLPELNELSLGSAVFPGGTAAYAYGSLFVDYLSRTRGDTTIARLLDAQSRELIPWRLNHHSRNAFGISFTDAFAAWRDSVQRSVAAGASTTLPGWREITHHGYYAQDPRWIDDSTLVYASNDGRSTAAEYVLRLNGDRSRLGRRNSLGPSVPVANGGLLFAQLEFTSPSEIRSDLYVERDGKQRRLTKGQRLLQPDARKDGMIVAVQLAATRTRLLTLDANGRPLRQLRDGGSDETWSEPRWSPDGESIAVVHRAHGGSFTLEIIDYATGESRVVERGPWLISAPAWSANSGAVYYVSEEAGVPNLMRATAVGGGRVPMQRMGEGNGIFTPDVAPSGKLAAVSLRANGYHVGVVDTLRPAGPIMRPPPAAPVVESEALAAGEYHRYSPLRSALPRFWNPILEDAPHGGVRLGATTNGRDVIGRHVYELSAATTTKGTFPTGSVVYRYAGFRRPFIDFDASQDYALEATLLNGGTTDVVGNMQRRTRSASLGATFVRARVRTYSSFSFGGGVERRKFISDPPELLKQLDVAFARQYQYPSVFVAGSWSNTQRPTLSISSEDGVSLAFTARGRTRSDSVSDRASASVIGTAALFKSLDLPGFAHHVIALRVAGGYADRRAASSLQVGGTSSGTIQIIPTYTVGEGRRTFGVRGFSSGSVFGTRAATGTLEYRAPLSLGGKGLGSLPFFFDRSSVSAFVDAGVADCAATPLNPSVCSPARLLGKAIASTGGELVTSAAIFDWDTPQRFRLGFAVPVAGRAAVGAKQVSVYAAYGLSF